jgi:hypothetical protein
VYVFSKFAFFQLGTIFATNFSLYASIISFRDVKKYKASRKVQFKMSELLATVAAVVKKSAEICDIIFKT